MKTLAYLLLMMIAATSCGPEASPEKRMNIKNHDLEQKIDAIAQQQQILRDSISMMDKELKALKH